MFQVGINLEKYQNQSSSSQRKQSMSNNNPCNSNLNRGDQERKSEINIIKQQNAELCQLKNNYIKLRDQYQQDKQLSEQKIMNLKQELYDEQNKIKDLEVQFNDLCSQSSQSPQRQQQQHNNMRSISVVEEIWNVMQSFQNTMKNSQPETELKSPNVQPQRERKVKITFSPYDSVPMKSSHQDNRSKIENQNDNSFDIDDIISKSAKISSLENSTKIQREMKKVTPKKCKR